MENISPRKFFLIIFCVIGFFVLIGFASFAATFDQNKIAIIFLSILGGLFLLLVFVGLPAAYLMNVLPQDLSEKKRFLFSSLIIFIVWIIFFSIIIKGIHRDEKWVYEFGKGLEEFGKLVSGYEENKK